jgi:hypothetical protein
MRTTITLILLSGLFAPGFARAMDCSAPSATQPLRPTLLAPVANELAQLGSSLGATNGVLSQGTDESESVDQVLLRIRIGSCQNMATVTPAPAPGGVVSPDNPATYKPRTQFDNAPWRFNMSQNGKNMTTDEFSAWMESRGVHVARGAPKPDSTIPAPDGGTSAVPAQVPAATLPAPAADPSHP